MVLVDACKTVRLACRRANPLFLSALLCAIAWFAAPRAGLADDRAAVARLEVERGPEAIDCPDASTLAYAVANIEGWAAVQTGATPSTAMQFDVEFAKDRTQYRARIRVSGRGSAVRSMTDDSPTCSNLASGIATHLALLVDEADAESKPSPAKTQNAQAMDSDGALPPSARDLARAPQDAPHNDLFLEILGNGPVFSVNYERFFFPDRNLGVRAGAGFFPSLPVCVFGTIGCPQTAASAVFPLLVNGYAGGSSGHRFQFGAGISYFTEGLFHGQPSCPALVGAAVPSPCSNPAELAGAQVLVTAVVGYRYLPPKGRFTFGFGLTPLLLFDGSSLGLLPLAGASAGVEF